MKYYDIVPILKENCKLNMIFGARSAGKTYAWKQLFLSEFMEFKEFRNSFIKKGIEKNYFSDKQFVYIRRTREELRLTAKYLFTDILNNYNKKYDENLYIDYRAGEFILCRNIENKLQKLYVIGYAIPLSMYERYKTASFDNVRYVVFEEALSKKQSTYLKDEVDNFVDLLNTIFRNRKDCKAFMIANIASNVNPYFEAWHISNYNGLKVYTYKKVKMAVDFTQGSNTLIVELKDNDFVNLASDKYIDYNIGEETLDDKSIMIYDKFKKCSKSQILIKTENNNFFIYSYKGTLYITAKKKKTIKKIYGLINNKFKSIIKYGIDNDFEIITNMRNYKDYTFINNHIINKLSDYYDNNLILFDNYKTRIYFEKLIKRC